MPQFFASASGYYPSIPEKILGGIMGQAGEQTHGNDTKQENNTRTQEEVIPQWSQLIARVTNNSSNPQKPVVTSQGIDQRPGASPSVPLAVISRLPGQQQRHWAWSVYAGGERETGST